MWDSGAETSRLPMSAAAAGKCAAPRLTLHRADRLDAPESVPKPGPIRFGVRVTGGAQGGATASLLPIADRVDADVVIGAGGIHSPVRTAVSGADRPRFTDLLSWRDVVPRSAVADLLTPDGFTKGRGPQADRRIVSFPLTRGAEILAFATPPRAGWQEEGWTLPGTVAESRDAHADFHPEARAPEDV